MKNFLIFSLLFVQANVFGQIEVKFDIKITNEGNEISIINDNSIDTADIDKDCITDTIRYDKNAKEYVAILSSQKNNPVYINNLDYVWFYEKTFISAENGGLSINSMSMHATNEMTYIYENNTEKLRLVEIWHDSNGNSGRGIEGFDLMNNRFIANWYYLDYDLSEIIDIPTFESKIDSKPIYSNDILTDTLINSFINSDSLYYQNKQKTIVEERCRRIDVMDLAKTRMPIVMPEELNVANEDFAYYLIYDDKKYRPSKTFNDDSKKNVAARIIKMKEHNGVNPYLIRFYKEDSFEDEFFYVLYINKGSSMDALYLGKGQNLSEHNNFEIDNDYIITLEKENKSYVIDATKCKFI